jgi:hypothetical protein
MIRAKGRRHSFDVFGNWGLEPMAAAAWELITSLPPSLHVLPAIDRDVRPGYEGRFLRSEIDHQPRHFLWPA